MYDMYKADSNGGLKEKQMLQLYIISSALDILNLEMRWAMGDECIQISKQEKNVD